VVVMVMVLMKVQHYKRLQSKMFLVFFGVVASDAAPAAVDAMIQN
jgi:hypothetical protein